MYKHDTPESPPKNGQKEFWYKKKKKFVNWIQSNFLIIRIERDNNLGSTCSFACVSFPVNYNFIKEEKKNSFPFPFYNWRRKKKVKNCWVNAFGCLAVGRGAHFPVSFLTFSYVCAVCNWRRRKVIRPLTQRVNSLLIFL